MREIIIKVLLIIYAVVLLMLAIVYHRLGLNTFTERIQFLKEHCYVFIGAILYTVAVIIYLNQKRIP